jgi:hypothetical protein
VFAGASGLRGLEIKVPEAVRRGTTVELSCDYDLEGALLYSIKWYKSDQEFFSYVPKEAPPSRVYHVDGIFVDVSDKLEIINICAKKEKIFNNGEIGACLSEGGWVERVFSGERRRFAKLTARERERHFETERALKPKGFQRVCPAAISSTQRFATNSSALLATSAAAFAAAGCHFRAQFIIEKVALLLGLLLRNQEYINAPFLSTRFQLCTCKLY